MANMSLVKNPMPSQDPNVRNKNFDEVALGYTKEQALDEAQRCLNCKHMPCVAGCPVNVQIPKFISLIAQGKFADACAAIKETSALPAVCGRVCPQETQCECKCVRGIKGEPVAIGRLERFAADWAREHNAEEIVKPESNGIKVAIIGAGPAVVDGGAGVTIGAPVVGGGGTVIIGGGAAMPSTNAPATSALEQKAELAAQHPIVQAAVADSTTEEEAKKLASIIRMANDELLQRAQAVLSPEMEAATQVYIEKLRILTETFGTGESQLLGTQWHHCHTCKSTSYTEQLLHNFLGIILFAKIFIGVKIFFHRYEKAEKKVPLLVFTGSSPTNRFNEQRK